MDKNDWGKEALRHMLELRNNFYVKLKKVNLSAKL